MERRKTCIGSWWGNLRERDQWGDPGVDGRFRLGWIFRKGDKVVWPGFGWLWIENRWRPLMNECGNELSGSKRSGEFLDQLQTGYIFKKDSAPWSE
jgi:hypothetical protein